MSIDRDVARALANPPSPPSLFFPAQEVEDDVR